MPEVELAAGTIDYDDTGGEGPVIVFMHGLSDKRHWRKVIAELRGEFRCVAPTMPLGSHPRPMKPDADLSLRGMGRIIADFIAALGLDDVTLSFSDWSCGQTMVADGLVDRVGRLVFVSCETEGNYPPGTGGQAVFLSARVPGGIALLSAILGSPRLRPLPMFYGQMTKVGIPDDLMREWLAPLKRPEIRRDFRKYILDAKQGKRDMRAATPALADFDRPVLVVWDSEGKMMPNKEGRKLADAFPDSRLVMLPDCRTLIPEDQPVRLAAEIREFAPAPAVR
jgi:pimeloyl-ACP methyl ester carboxylesterase